MGASLSSIISKSEFSLRNLWEQMICENYSLMVEYLNIDNYYEYQPLGNSSWEFESRDGYKNIIKVNYTLSTNNPSINVKFFWMNEGKASYDKVPISDEKIFNTYMRVFVREILPKLKNYFDHFGLDELTLDVTDNLRYRLYRSGLNKILDKSKYNIIEDPTKNTLYIKLKGYKVNNNNPYNDFKF